MIRVQLPFPIPLSACFTNATGKGRVPTKRYLAWQEASLWTIKAQRPGKLAGAVSVYVRLVAPSRRRYDADNLGKALLDLLTKAGIIEDDSNRFVKRLTYEWAEDGPPCLVVVDPVGAGQ